MALNKVPYVDGVTVITAENLNDIQDAIIALENAPAQGLTEDMKQALLQIARKVAYIDDQGQTYYDDLYDAFYPPKTVVLITAVFEQGSTVIYDDTALDDLKQYLQVTAKYDDNTTAILADNAYSLSGLLEAPSSVVTVLYNDVSTTFSVAVTARPTLSSISAVYTQSGMVYTTDTLDSLKADLVVTANYSDSSTQTVPAADYTLSGTLTEGTSTITVSYGGKTTTFDVTVTSGLIYSLYNQTFDKTVAGVNSGLKLCENDTSFTILFDGIQTSDTGGNRLFVCLQPASPYKGIYVGSTSSSGNNNIAAEWFNASNNIGFGKTSSGRIRVLYSHEANSGKVTVSWKSNSGVTTFTLTNAFVSHTSTLIVASAGTGDWAKANTWVGTLTKFEVYNRALSQSEIDAFFG